MATCVHCGKGCGWFDTAHLDCATAAEAAAKPPVAPVLRSDDRGNVYEVHSREISAIAAPSIGFWKIAFAVMVGNLLAGLVAAFVYAMVH